MAITGPSLLGVKRSRARDEERPGVREEAPAESSSLYVKGLSSLESGVDEKASEVWEQMVVEREVVKRGGGGEMGQEEWMTWWYGNTRERPRTRQR